MTLNTVETDTNVAKPQWYRDLGDYAHSDMRKAIIQIITTFTPYLALWSLMIYLVLNDFPYWMVLLVVPFQAAITLRIFIIFHDCCHGSFFKSNRLNTIFGYLTGTLTFTPFRQWRAHHNAHHATSGDLDRRGMGDIGLLTIEEYRQLTTLSKLKYRFSRNPFVIFGLGSIWIFMFVHRFTKKVDDKKTIRSVWITNFFILIYISALGLTIGFLPYIKIALPVMYVSGAIGIWMFYVQHQFEDAYWRMHSEWDQFAAGIKGSSYYKLPKILHWVSGNIGFHHIHHLHPRIPNYHLQRCFREIKALSEVEPLTILMSLKLPWLSLWDEGSQKLVGYRSL